MGHATYDQTSFLGGEWSKFMQGRSDHKNYRSAMNLCYNGMPVEQGAWTRRPGTRALAPTYKGKPALIRPVWFSENAPFLAEFTDSALRFFYGSYPTITPEVHSVISVSAANPAILKLDDTVSWAAGDEIAILSATGATATVGRLLRQRSFTVTPQAFAPAAWSSGTTYGIGSFVSKGGVNYQSLQANNLNQDPAVQTAWWVVVTGSNLFKLTDALTGVDVDGTIAGQSIAAGSGGILGVATFYAVKIFRLTTPYSSGSWASVRLAQNENVCLAMNGTKMPQAFYIVPNAGTPNAVTGALNPVNFVDGPYLDPVNTSIATVSGLSGIVTVTVTFPAYDATKTYGKGDWVTNGTATYKSLIDGNLNNLVTDITKWEAHDKGAAVTGDNVDTIGFQATDVGRLMRFFNRPADWNALSTYVIGNQVYYNNQTYEASQGVAAGLEPDANPTFWTIKPSGQIWTYGKITVVGSTNSVTVLIQGPALLYNVPCFLWRLGVYSDTTGYPTCGIFYKGRFWFGGALPNRFDTSRTQGVDRDGTIRMSPTESDGTVTDTCGISYTFLADDHNPIFWFSTDQHGLVAGTAGGEWLIAASNLNDPITPSSIDANRVTKYRCANVEPKRTPMATVFVQAYKKKVLEFIADVFSGRYTAPHLSETAKHLTNQGVEEMGYQEETTPTLWFRTSNNALIGAAYRRTSAFATEAPAFIGWHQHVLGHGRKLECLTVGPSQGGAVDAPSFITSDGTYRYVETMTQMFDETSSLYDAWFLDGAMVPDQMIEETVGGALGITFTGLYYLIGKTVTVFAGGLDMGEYTVAADGTVHVPYGNGVPPALIDYSSSGWGKYAFTAAYVTYILGLGLTLVNGGVLFVGNTTITTVTTIPNPNGTGNKLQSFISAQGWTGIATPDWNNSLLWMPTQDQTIVTLMNLADGTEARHATIATVTGTVGDGINNSGASLGIDNAGNGYWAWGSSNFDPIISVTKNLTLRYRAGTTSTFGPPGTNGMSASGASVIPEANSAWIVNAGVGLALWRGSDGQFIAGNGSSDTAFMGLNQTSWTLEGFLSALTSGARGKPLVVNGYQVAAAYYVQKGADWNTNISFFIIGVSDGTPAGGGVGITYPDAGKKGKGKKGASSGSVFHQPTTQNPVVALSKIGELACATVDPAWLHYSDISSTVVDQYDNSFILAVMTDTSGRSAWSNATTYAVGDVVSKSSNLYQCIQATNLNHDPDTDVSGLPFPATGTWWRQVPRGYFVNYKTGQFSGFGATYPQGLGWKVPIVGISTPNIGPLGATARVQGGVFGFLDNKNGIFGAEQGRIYMVDTTTGKYFVGNVPGVFVNSAGGQSWDDATMSVIYEGLNDTSQVGHPTLLNSTTSDTGTNKWYRLYIGDGIPLDPTVISTLSVQPEFKTFLYITPGGPFGGGTGGNVSGGFPAVIGSNYESKGQMLRAVDQQQAGSRTGPALGALRASKTLAVLLQATLGIEFGTDFTTMVKSSLKDRDSGLQPLPATSNLTFSGTWRDTLEGKTDFDAMVAWRVKRPVPAAVVAVGPNVNVEDR